MPASFVTSRRFRSALRIPVVLAAGPLWIGSASAAVAELAPPSIARYIAVDNVCAWPNLTLLGDAQTLSTAM